MLKLPITYRDLEDEEVTEDFYFNVTVPEAVELASRQEGGFAVFLRDISAKRTGAEVMAGFTDLVRLAYAKREGNQLVKDERVTKIFMTSDAYSVLFMRLISEAKFGADFVVGLFPKDLQEKVKMMQDSAENVTDGEPVERPIESYTTQELISMSEDEFQALRKKHKMNAPKAMLLAAFQRD